MEAHNNSHRHCGVCKTGAAPKESGERDIRRVSVGGDREDKLTAWL